MIRAFFKDSLEIFTLTIQLFYTLRTWCKCLACSSSNQLYTNISSKHTTTYLL